MPYTLKLDWTHERAKAAGAALRRADLDELADDFAWLGEDGEPGEDATLKLEWSAAEINAARHALGAELVRLGEAMGNTGRGDDEAAVTFRGLVETQNQVWAARRDIESYLVVSASLSDVSRAALAERPL
jgi:hypothetical protein